MKKQSLLMGASALIIAGVAVASAAQAQTQIFGGGSTLVSPALRQAEDCYGNPVGNTVNQGAYPYGANTAFPVSIAAFNYTGTKGTQNCSTTHVDSSVQINYLAAGSGNGELSVFTHDETLDFGDTTNSGSTPPLTLQYSSIQYGAGDYGISATEAGSYAAGGTLSQTTGGSATVVILPVGSTVTPSGTTYANPTPLYGNFIQMPITVDAVAMAYSPVYKKITDGSGVTTSYKFHIKTTNKDGSGGLKLDMKTICAIANGQITNWNDPALKALNSGASLRDTTDPVSEATWESTGLPIETVGRADSSGTTSIFYRALAAQCNSTSSGYTGTNNFAAGGSKKLPTALQGPTWSGTTIDNGPNSGVTPVLGEFTRATGSDLVAAYAAFSYTPTAGSSWSQGRLAYIGPDYTLLATNSTNNHFGLAVGNVAPLSGKPGVEPTYTNALKAFGSSTNTLLPPQSNTAGTYVTTSIAHDSFGLRSHPEDWVEPISTTVSFEGGTAIPTPLADPNHNIPGTVAAYPMVGTTQAFLNTCYTSTNAPKMLAFLGWYLTSTLVNDAKLGVLVQDGLGPMPKAWATATNATFVKPTVSGKTVGTDSLNLNILAAGTAANSKGFGGQCHTVSPGA